MKRISIYITIALFVFSGCSKDLLNVSDPNNVTEDNFYQTENDAVLATNAVYNSLRDDQNYGQLIIWESVLTDDERWDGEGTPNLYGALASGTETAIGTNSYTRRVWNGSYQTIYRANTAIAKIPAIAMDDALKNRLLAECRFLRAFMYHRLVVRFGDVPLLLHLPAEEPLTPPRASRQEVLAAIYDDLDFAAQSLPKEYTGADAGRIKKGAAYLLKAKVQLFNQQWADAAVSAKACLDLHYGLYPSYADLFTKPGNENLNESLFEVQWGNANGNGGNGNLYTRNTSNGTASTVAAGGWDWGQVLQNLVNEYENADGTPFNLGGRDITTDLTQYQDRDPRLYTTFFFHGADYFGIPFDRTWSRTQYCWKKYTLSTTQQNSFPQGMNPYNWIVLRNAEAHLAYAEAKNEAAGPDESVYDAVNAVRRRAGMPNLPGGLSQDDMRARIRHERRVELAGESVRFEDLVRWRALKSALESKSIGNPGVTWVISNWEEFRYLWPVPQQERDVNKNLTQNPGY